MAAAFSSRQGIVRFSSHICDMACFYSSKILVGFILWLISAVAIGIIHEIQDGLQDDAGAPLFDHLTCVNEPRFLVIIPGKAFRMILPEEWIYKRRLRRFKRIFRKSWRRKTSE